MAAVAVFCASSEGSPAPYRDLASQVGAAIAAQGWDLVFGGTMMGPMASLATGAKAAGGRVIGIMPNGKWDTSVAAKACDELLFSDGLSARKDLMLSRSDAIVALPGGVGTLDEWYGVLAQKVVGDHNKPMVLLNAFGFYDGLLAWQSGAEALGFIKARYRKAYDVCDTCESMVTILTRQLSKDGRNKCSVA